MRSKDFVGPLSALTVLAAFGAAFAFSTPVPAMDAEAQAPAETRSSASLVEAGSYTADPAHSFITFTVDHMGVTPYTGIFGDPTGTLMLDPARPTAAKVDMTIPVSAITVTSAALKDHLLRAAKEKGGKPDFFGPSPADAHFVSTGIVSTGSQTATMTGKFTLNGITKDISMPVEFHGAAKMPPQMNNVLSIGFTAHTEIKRSDYGLGFGVPMVSDTVKLDIVAAFMKDAPQP